MLEHSYLIQRLQKPWGRKLLNRKVVDNPFSFGGGLLNGGLSKDAMNLLRGILFFDYMGSAEFEWGAVPQALSFLAQQASEKSVTTGIILCEKKPVYFICPTKYESAVRSRIWDLYDDEYKVRLKEHCGLKDSLTSEKEYAKRNCGWLELDNGFAFFTDKRMFKSFAKLFGVDLPEKLI